MKQIGQMGGLLGEEDEEVEDLGKSLKLNEDFLDEDWDPEKHEVFIFSNAQYSLTCTLHRCMFFFAAIDLISIILLLCSILSL